MTKLIVVLRNFANASNKGAMFGEFMCAHPDRSGRDADPSPPSSAVVKNRVELYEGGSKSFRTDQLFKVTEIKQLCYFSIQSPFISTHTDTDTLTSS
jgi:hypothetical protein